ncbi:cysteine--tRNA ligase, partial [bacterium]|nr:cysteine--tRNA ligase [bacterium]
LLDDLNTPRALAALHDASNRFFKSTNDVERARLKGEILAVAQTLGILQQTPQQWFQQGSADDLTAEAIDALLDERQSAKKNRDFARADAIRDELAAAGVMIQDTRDGTRWSREG